MLTLGLGVPHGHFLAKYYAPISGEWQERIAEIFLQIFQIGEYRERKAAPAEEPHPKRLLGSRKPYQPAPGAWLAR